MKNTFNGGFAFLRIWMSFEVVLCHFWRYDGLTATGDFLKHLIGWAVPVFMLMSFFLAEPKFEKNDPKWLGKRFFRIALPFVVWSVVTFLCIWGASPLTDSPRFVVGWKDLGWELLLGCSSNICPQFWFQSALLIMTALLALALKIARPRRLVAVAVGFFLASFFLQYTGLVGTAFDKFPNEAKWTLGRLSPMLAYVGLGLLLGVARPAIDRAPAAVRVAVSVLAVAAFATTYFHPLFTMPPPGGYGYGYSGFQNLLMAVLLMAACYYWPTERFPSVVVRVLKTLSAYTMGVYCIHILIGRMLTTFVYPHFGLGEKTMQGAIAIYVVSWTVCWLLARIPHFDRIVK